MNIFNFNKKPEDEKYVGALRRGAAVSIDVWIVLILRVMAMQILGKIWMEQQLITFFEEFEETFGTQTIKDTPEHLNFILHHTIFIHVIIFYSIVVMVGAIYHALLNSCVWQATIGKRIMKIIMVKENGARISFQRALLHYFLSLLPFAFLFYLMSYQIRNHLTFYQAIMSSQLNLIFGILFVLWVQIHLFTKKRTTAYDIICNTLIINGKTSFKWPWSKQLDSNA